MSAETLARNLAIAMAVAFVLVVIAFLPQLRQALKEQPRPRPSQKWRLAFLVVTLLLVAGAAFEGRWASAIAWLFFTGIWALFILLEWKKGRNQP